MLSQFEKLGTFHKVQGDTAYGWALVSTIAGVPYFDTGDGKHSDHIPQETLPEVAAEFMKAFGAGKDMHRGDQIADVLFAYPMTDDIMKGVEVSSNKTGLLIGWQPYDKAILEKIASGDRIGFSIGGIVTGWDIVDEQGNIVETIDATGKAVSAAPGQRFGTITALAKAAGYDGKGGMKRRVFRSWKLHEVSLVDKPMQEGALVGVVKGAGGVTYKKVRSIARAFSKGAMLTSVDEGHQHVVDPQCCDESGMGRTSYERSTNDEYGHDHAFVRNADGSYTIAANEGHTHTVTVPSLADGAPAGTTVAMRAPESTPAAGNLPAPIATGSVANKSDTPETTHMITEQEHEALKKKATRLAALVDLPDAQRGYAKRLTEEALDAFLAKSVADRAAEVKASTAYTSTDGTVFYATDDQRYVEMAKRADKAEQDNVLEKSLRQKAEFAKAAAESMAHYPEDADTHLAVIEAIETSIKDPELKKKAHSLIKSGDAALKNLSKPSGNGGPVNKNNPVAADDLKQAEEALKGAVETFGKAKGITNYQLAFAEATGSDPATRAAYSKVRELRKQLAD